MSRDKKLFQKIHKLPEYKSDTWYENKKQFSTYIPNELVDRITLYARANGHKNRSGLLKKWVQDFVETLPDDNIAIEKIAREILKDKKPYSKIQTFLGRCGNKLRKQKISEEDILKILCRAEELYDNEQEEIRLNTPQNTEIGKTKYKRKLSMKDNEDEENK